MLRHHLLQLQMQSVLTFAWCNKLLILVVVLLVGSSMATCYTNQSHTFTVRTKNNRGQQPDTYSIRVAKKNNKTNE